MKKTKFIETWKQSCREVSESNKENFLQDIKQSLIKARYQVEYLSGTASCGEWELDNDEKDILARDLISQTYLDMHNIAKEIGNEQ